MRKKELEIILESLSTFENPKIELEQYVTPSPLAAEIAINASLFGDLDTVADLGCGTGILGIAAALLGAKVIGFDIDLEALKIARRNAQNLGLDINFVRRKDGKIRYHFFLAEVKRERKQANEKEVLLFLKKCEDLIRILESEISNLPQVLKPKFTLWFISYAGFTPKARMVFGRTQKPPRTQCKLVDINELNEMLREYKLKTYSVT